MLLGLLPFRAWQAWIRSRMPASLRTPPLRGRMKSSLGLPAEAPFPNVLARSMNDSWLTLLPDRLGDMPLGGDLLRTDAAGLETARVALFGVHPAATEWQHATVNGQAVKLPVAVERTSFDPHSKSGEDLFTKYLRPLGLARQSVLLLDLWPYFLANTRRESGRKSLADSIREYEAVTGHKTAVEARPTGNELLSRIRSAPGNLDRLRSIVRHAPRLVLTLGSEAAAFARGLERAAAAQEYFYRDPEELEVASLGLRATFVHLAHPSNGKPALRARHEAWALTKGPELVRTVTAAP
jgi:hypothetical protein